VKQVIVHTKARKELNQAIGYYERQRRGLGLDLLTEVEDAIFRIQEDPSIGSPYKETKFQYLLVRRFPYLIYYVDLRDRLWIAAIAHGRRRPGYWRRRRLE
jgi:toxin ParE1/3/4